MHFKGAPILCSLTSFFGDSPTNTNPTSDSYVYPVCLITLRLPIIPYSESKVQREAQDCPSRSPNAPTMDNGLSRRNSKPCYSMFRYAGSNTSFFFINVQAITSIFAASLTRIFVLIPRSRSLPRSSLVKYALK